MPNMAQCEHTTTTILVILAGKCSNYVSMPKQYKANQRLQSMQILQATSVGHHHHHYIPSLILLYMPSCLQGICSIIMKIVKRWTIYGLLFVHFKLKALIDLRCLSINLQPEIEMIQLHMNSMDQQRELLSTHVVIMWRMNVHLLHNDQFIRHNGNGPQTQILKWDNIIETTRMIQIQGQCTLHCIPIIHPVEGHQSRIF